MACDPAGPDWPAPAKLNLFLHVVGRRQDGYHLLQTVFQLIDLCDRIGFALRDDERITRSGGLASVPEDQDLTVRAARLLQTQTGTRRGVDISIDKRIPEGGGLGGGSSDAATVLVALNRLWGLGLSLDRLAELGLWLGADVPVFVRGRAAWAEGVGEVLTPIEPAEPWYAVILPDVTVPTAAVFADPELTRNTPPMTIRDFLSGQGRNDCEPVVRRRFPQVDAAMTWCARHGPPRLTGTGACVFVPLLNEQQAQKVAQSVPAPWRGFAVRGCNRSPLHERLARES